MQDQAHDDLAKDGDGDPSHLQNGHQDLGLVERLEVLVKQRRVLRVLLEVVAVHPQRLGQQRQERLAVALRQIGRVQLGAVHERGQEPGVLGVEEEVAGVRAVVLARRRGEAAPARGELRLAGAPGELELVDGVGEVGLEELVLERLGDVHLAGGAAGRRGGHGEVAVGEFGPERLDVLGGGLFLLLPLLAEAVRFKLVHRLSLQRPVVEVQVAEKVDDELGKENAAHELHVHLLLGLPEDLLQRLDHPEPPLSLIHI